MSAGIVATSQQARAAELNSLTRKQRSLWTDALYRLIRNRFAVLGLVIIAFTAVLAIFADRIAPYDPIAQNTPKQLMEPLWTQSFGSKFTDPGYLLGSDELGRDILSRLLYSFRISLVVGLVPVSMVLMIGITLGMLAGYFGGWVDQLVGRIVDVVYAFPDLLFVIIIMATLRATALGEALGGLVLIFGAIAIVGWTGLTRLVRGQVLSMKNREFIEAARAIGAPSSRIMFRHLLPNVLAPVIVSTAFAIPGAMLTEATLSYIGIGIRPPTPSLGSMIQDGFVVFSSTPWPVLLPAICISVLLLSFTFVGDGLRDALDPRMKT